MALSSQIRILDLLPYDHSGPDGPIRCETRVVALSDEPVYEALSYRWGSEGDRRAIIIASRQASVTANLYAALLRLRLHNATRSLWIDQLCINQEDMDEKVSQVHLMGHIYSYCTRCLIWLDELDASISLDDAKAALEILAWVANQNLPTPSCVQSLNAARGPIKALTSIGVAEHPWWNRIWTVKEVILPPRKTFVWGPLQIDWETLSQCADARISRGLPWELDELGARTDIDIEGSLRWLLVNVLWINRANVVRDVPIQTVMKWRSRKATDPRDKIFGLLGLLPSDMEMPHTHKCDYKTPAAQVYCAFTLDMILHEQNLVPLVNEPRAPPGAGTVGLPRWATDMDSVILYQVDTFYRLWGYHEYDACAERKLDTTALSNAAAEPEFHMRVLGLTGVMVDTVEVIGVTILLTPRAPAEAARPFGEIAETLRSWMEMARQFHQRLYGGLNREQFEEAFYRVLLSNRIRDVNQFVVRLPSTDDLAATSEFVRTASGLINDMPFWARYVGNQTFFITKSGMMGMGHLETEPGDEVWVFDGGAMPFTIRPREGGNDDDFDFVGCCYAHNIMEGQVYNDEKTSASRRTVRVY